LSTTDYTSKILGMEDVIIEDYTVSDSAHKLVITMPRRTHICPVCGTETATVHDYRERQIVDLSIQNKRTILRYRRRRYQCPCCNKRFAELCSFAGRYQRFTSRVAIAIMDCLHTRQSMKDIARQTGTTVSGVARCLGLQPQTPPRLLPEVLSLDEFKGNVDGEKFQCILTAPLQHKVFDILPSRHTSTVQDYLKRFPNRNEVKAVVMDMNSGFRDVVRAFLPYAKIVIDRFHVVRYCTWAMDDVRRKLQKSLKPETRKYFKRSRKLLLAHHDKLSEEDRQAVSVMLGFSDSLHQAYALKETFYQFMASPDSTVGAQRLHDWLEAQRLLAIPEFKACARMLRNWKPYILNAFDLRVSNGFTEGCNNGSKTLKRVAFGFRNFRNFRARILLAADHYPNI